MTYETKHGCKISRLRKEQDYANLKNEISIVYEEIHKKRIDSLSVKNSDIEAGTGYNLWRI